MGKHCAGEVVGLVVIVMIAKSRLCIFDSTVDTRQTFFLCSFFRV